MLIEAPKILLKENVSYIYIYTNNIFYISLYIKDINLINFSMVF